jgi:hypothetical protein
VLRDLHEALARADLPAETLAKARIVQSVLDRDPQARLESFWIAGDRPYAVIAFGDPLAADLVVYLLHGMETDLSALPGWADAAQRLCADVIRSCVVRGEPRAIATIVWFGWDSGTQTSVLATKHATIGAARLAVDIDRLADRNPRGHIAVVTYSYSTTLLGEMFALNIADKVRTAFAIASAGVTHAAGAAIESAIADGEVVVYATEGAGDGTAPLGRLGHHPIDPRDLRGVVVYDCDGGEAPGVDGDLVMGVAVEGHASQTAIDERGIRHPGYFDERAQGYLTLVARLTDAVTR